MIGAWRIGCLTVLVGRRSTFSCLAKGDGTKVAARLPPVPGVGLDVLEEAELFRCDMLGVSVKCRSRVFLPGFAFFQYRTPH